ncbi:MAG: geranylgeranylglyceryl/heptaprenylglyceryl phosphate synthase [Candidatus Marinimicrobia bacterium]|nr:geranylgeranylglyceryl/heptaprenylglyceryl phosphate synthase [Candidatus Neomarinimicrobiota bacterium]MCF7851249.1 geranylgeranylglyceryl/heptaprenylglyceryl phosphate synthase [Candidatus Neomarinimicrobiota bacterium]
MSVYDKLMQVKSERGAGYFVLIDPDRWEISDVDGFVDRINTSGADAIMVGSSLILGDDLQKKMKRIHELSDLPVILFPGNLSQLTPHVDAVFYLVVISGRNPQFLIGDQVQGAPIVKEMGIEPISTGYMLIESGRVTSAEFISGSKPIPRDKPEIAAVHALAAEYMGFKLVYLEAGSGAEHAVSPEMVQAVSQYAKVPIIVGGGIKTPEEAEKLVQAGASFVVTGNVLEDESKAHLMEQFAAAIHTG